jgi:hypothetical protein
MLGPGGPHGGTGRETGHWPQAGHGGPAGGLSLPRSGDHPERGGKAAWPRPAAENIETKTPAQVWADAGLRTGTSMREMARPLKKLGGVNLVPGGESELGPNPYIASN